MNKSTIFKATAWWAGLYHLGLGVTGVFADPPLMASIINRVFGASLEITPQVFYLVKFCSAYMIAFALAMILLALQPEKHKKLLWIPLSLFAIRLLERLYFSDLLTHSLGIPFRQEMITTVILAVLIVLLFFSRPKEADAV